MSAGAHVLFSFVDATDCSPTTQVLDGIKFKHLFCIDTKFLLTRDCTVSRHPYRPQHWHTSRRRCRRPGIHQVRTHRGFFFWRSELLKKPRHTSSPVGVFPKPENAVFVPIPVTLRANDAERSGRAYRPSVPDIHPQLFSAQSIFLKTLRHHRLASLHNSRVLSRASSKCSIVC